MKKREIGNKKYTNTSVDSKIFTQQDMDLIYTDSYANDSIINFLLNEIVCVLVAKSKHGNKKTFLDETYLFGPSFMNKLTNNGEFTTAGQVEMRYAEHMHNYGRIDNKSLLLDKKYLIIVNNKRSCHWSFYVFFMWTEDGDDTFPLVFVFDSMTKINAAYDQKMISCISRFLEMHLMHSSKEEVFENVSIDSLMSHKRSRRGCDDDDIQIDFKINTNRGIVNVNTHKQTDEWSCGYWVCTLISRFMGFTSEEKLNTVVDIMNKNLIFPEIDQQFVYDILSEFRRLIRQKIIK